MLISCMEICLSPISIKCKEENRFILPIIGSLKILNSEDFQNPCTFTVFLKYAIIILYLFLLTFYCSIIYSRLEFIYIHDSYNLFHAVIVLVTIYIYIY